ncbi:hypothetical protein [Leucobacter sp. USHLN154]|uniref:hypothetical protein n=1 Tax=Leucobacter sp. USHLN154 TaxID=3081269 RepID=UPI003018F079
MFTDILDDLCPGKPRGSIHDRVCKLNRFWNRLAHWEPVFSTTTGLASRLREFEEFFNLVDPQVAAWVGSQSEVIETLKKCPVSGINLVDDAYSGKVP